MNRSGRRAFVTAGLGLVGLVSSGCLGRTPGDSDAVAGDDIQVGFEPSTGGNSATSRERIVLENSSDSDLDLGGFVLQYESGDEYEFDGLVLEPGAAVAVVSQGTGDAVAESDPPTYYRDAELDELVLEDGQETVELFDADGNLVLEATYRE